MCIIYLFIAVVKTLSPCQLVTNCANTIINRSIVYYWFSIPHYCVFMLLFIYYFFSTLMIKSTLYAIDTNVCALYRIELTVRAKEKYDLFRIVIVIY